MYETQNMLEKRERSQRNKVRIYKFYQAVPMGLRPFISRTHLPLLRTRLERLHVLQRLFHLQLLTSPVVGGLLVFGLFLVKGGVGSIFVRHANVDSLVAER
jgi:hypothetical protein